MDLPQNGEESVPLLHNLDQDQSDDGTYEAYGRNNVRKRGDHEKLVVCHQFLSAILNLQYQYDDQRASSGQAPHERAVSKLSSLHAGSAIYLACHRFFLKRPPTFALPVLLRQEIRIIRAAEK
jgi:hypothetical protein